MAVTVDKEVHKEGEIVEKRKNGKLEVVISRE